jgi:hypothetical protein
MSSWQVFGLTGRLLAPASQSFFRLLPVQRMSQLAIAVSGHGFSRATNILKNRGALAPEGCFSIQLSHYICPNSYLSLTSALRSERSFLFTAAGQFRPHTGFPFHRIWCIRNREVKLL